MSIFVLLLVITSLTLSNTQPHIHISSVEESLIAGGRDANKGEFAHHIGISKPDGSLVWCGGGIISKRWILTAAHCFESSDNKYNTIIYVGKTRRSNATDGRAVKIESIQTHTDFDNMLYKNDIAVVKLGEDVLENEYIKYMSLETKEQPKGTIVSASGWGLIPAGVQPDNLQTVNLPIVEDNLCRDHGDIFPEMQICVGSGNNKDTCRGDSGGPIVHKLSVDPNRWVAIGITSFGGAECGGNNVRGTYTKVSKYLDWLASKNVTFTAASYGSEPSSLFERIKLYFFIFITIFVFGHVVVASDYCTRMMRGEDVTV